MRKNSLRSNESRPVEGPWRSAAPTSRRAGALLVAAALALGGCAPEGPGPAPVSARATLHYADEAGSTSRVERTILADGSEALHAVTDIASAGASTRITEDVRLDPRGRLVRAEIARASDRVILAAARGTVLVVRSGETTRRRVPADVPWVYAQVLDAAGRPVATPLAAWVAHRAAAASERVRVLGAEAGEGRVIPRDQLAVATESGTTVVLGYDGADVEPGPLPGASPFVVRVRVASLGTTLSLDEGPSAVGAATLSCR